MADKGRPVWVDDELFPFESRFVAIDGHTVHYVDEGSGPTLLMLHGNPTWSFVYRDVIAALRDEFRCVAIDYPGFGSSSARSGYRYLPEEHTESLAHPLHVSRGDCTRPNATQRMPVSTRSLHRRRSALRGRLNELATEASALVPSR